MKIKKYLAIASVGVILLGGISLASTPTNVYAEEGRTNTTFKSDEVEATASAYVDDPGAVAVNELFILTIMFIEACMSISVRISYNTL